MPSPFKLSHSVRAYLQGLQVNRQCYLFSNNCLKLFCILDWNTTNHVLYPEQKQLVAFTTLIDLSLYCYKLYTCEWKCVSLTGIPKTPRTFVNFYLLSCTVKKLCSSACIKSRVSHSCITPSVSCHLSYSMLCGKVGGAKLHRCSSLHFFADALLREPRGEWPATSWVIWLYSDEWFSLP